MKYILTSPRLKGKILFEYTLNGIIKSFIIEQDDDVTDTLVKWIFARFPVNVKAFGLPEFQKVFTIEQVPDDLSFEAFWEAYGYKVGNKDRAKKLWNLLTDPERAQALMACSKYKRYLSTKPTMEQA